MENEQQQVQTCPPPDDARFESRIPVSSDPAGHGVMTRLLALGELIDRVPHTGAAMNPLLAQSISEAEESLADYLYGHPSQMLETVFGYGVKRDGTVTRKLDRIVIRVVAIVLDACLTKAYRGEQVIKVARMAALNGTDYATILLARHHVVTLCERKVFSFRAEDDWPGCVGMGQYLNQLGSMDPRSRAAELTEARLRAVWNDHKSGATGRTAPVAGTKKTGREIFEKLQRVVIGMDDVTRVFSTRIAIHQHRAAMLSANQRGQPVGENECILLIGPSGAGKTFLCEEAGRVCGLPFASVSATDITQTGYVGLDVEDAVKPLVRAAEGDIARARYGMILVDEFDKKASSASLSDRGDIGGRGVQAAFLRLMAGTDFQVGGRRSDFSSKPFMFNSRGTCFVFAGAFSGLDHCLKKGASVSGMGFGSVTRSLSRDTARLYDALEEYGFLPEWLNRLTSILVVPAPTRSQLRQIAQQATIPQCRKLVESAGADLEVTDRAVSLLVDYALETRTFARGLKSLLSKCAEQYFYECEKFGDIKVTPSEVRAAIESLRCAPLLEKREEICHGR